MHRHVLRLMPARKPPDTAFRACVRGRTTVVLEEDGFGSLYEAELRACFPRGVKCVTDFTLNDKAFKHMDSAFQVMSGFITKPRQWNAPQQRQVKPDIMVLDNVAGVIKEMASEFVTRSGEVKEIDELQVPECEVPVAEISVQPSLSYSKLFQIEKIICGLDDGIQDDGIEDDLQLPQSKDAVAVIALNGDKAGFLQIAPDFAAFFRDASHRNLHVTRLWEGGRLLMVYAPFRNTYSEVSAVHAKLQSLDAKLQSLENRMDEKMQSLENRMDGLERRAERLDEKLDEILRALSLRKQ